MLAEFPQHKHHHEDKTSSRPLQSTISQVHHVQVDLFNHLFPKLIKFDAVKCANLPEVKHLDASLCLTNGHRNYGESDTIKNLYKQWLL